jgi:hypothetical protein
MFATCLRGQKEQQEDLGRLRERLQQSRSEVDRLVDMRLRHDLGLPVQDAGELFKSDTPVTSEAMDKARRDLQSEDIATGNLLQRFNSLKQQVDQLQSEAEAQAKKHQNAEEWLTVPRPGTAPESHQPPNRATSPWWRTSSRSAARSRVPRITLSWRAPCSSRRWR